MNKNYRQAPQSNKKHRVVLAAISASITLAVIGVWYVIVTIQPEPVTLPTATVAVATAPFVTKVVTAAPTNTPIPPANTPSPTPTPTINAPLTLAVVHSNDTWGYVQPCG